MFDIRLDRRGRLNDASGEMAIGEFQYEFLIDLNHWSAPDYWASWLRSASHVLNHGYGRFALSVTKPGGLYETWPCWVKDGAAVFHKSILLGSITGDYARAEVCETPVEDYAERGHYDAKILYYSCPMQDVADFERRLRKSAVQ